MQATGISDLPNKPLNDLPGTLTVYRHKSRDIPCGPNSLRVAGMELYQKNQSMRLFANVMEHPEFSLFINEYLLRDPEAIIKLIKLYQQIGEFTPDPYERLAKFHASLKLHFTRVGTGDLSLQPSSYHGQD
jgi:hypothetical protein